MVKKVKKPKVHEWSVIGGPNVPDLTLEQAGKKLDELGLRRSQCVGLLSLSEYVCGQKGWYGFSRKFRDYIEMNRGDSSGYRIEDAKGITWVIKK
jgi:hypothetical protein